MHEGGGCRSWRLGEVFSSPRYLPFKSQREQGVQEIGNVWFVLFPKKIDGLVSLSLGHVITPHCGV